MICDDNYSPYLATMVASICSNTGAFVECHVIGKGTGGRNRTMIESMKERFPNFSIDFRVCDPSGIYGIDYLSLSRMTVSTFIRMLLPDLYPEIDRALIMDVDIISLQDIGLLWKQELDGHVFAAALDEPDTARRAFLRNLEVDTDCRYANCGVMIVDCRKWRERGITARCLEVERKYRDVLECADQDVINKVFLGDFKVLESRFNSLLGNDEDMVNRHFSWLRKPWFSKYNAVGDLIKNFDDWWHYAAMTPFYPEVKARYDSLTQGDDSSALKARANYERMEMLSFIRNSMKRNNTKKQ